MPKAYYLKLGSGGIVGTSCDPHHVGWIKLETFYFGNARNLGGSVGPGKVAISEFLVSKAADRISPQLMQASNNGMGFKSAIIEIADSRTGIPALRINLTGVMIDKFAGTGAASGYIEVFTIHFANVEFNHNPIAEDALEGALQPAVKNMGRGPDRQGRRL
jgi:type VI protein secretion system component Hcp